LYCSPVQQMCGHKSATMTLDLYGHLFPDRLDVIADAVDAARAAELPNGHIMGTRRNVTTIVDLGKRPRLGGLLVAPDGIRTRATAPPSPGKPSPAPLACHPTDPSRPPQRSFPPWQHTRMEWKLCGVDRERAPMAVLRRQPPFRVGGLWLGR
jgi:hypothetical protein